MKKSGIYIVVLLALLALATFLFLRERKKYDPALERAFQVLDMAALSKIELDDRKGNAMYLEKVKGTWLLNGEENVRPAILAQLLDALANMYAEIPVPEVAQDNVLKQMLNISTKVSLYQNDEKKAYKVFYVGGGTPDNIGTYMLMEINGVAASRPYIIRLPGFRGYLTYRFAPAPEAWRSIALCNYLPEEIKRISIKYHQEDALQSFDLSRNNGSMELNNMGEIYKESELNKELATGLFSSFMNLHFEKNIDSLAQKDSIMQANAYLQLQVETSTGETKTLDVFYMPLGFGSTSSADTSVVFKYDMDRLYAFDQERQKLISIQYAGFASIFLKANQLIASPQQD
ncbi:MAG: hypothetical protein H6579_01850 [Chitinophagales bacterium]|nr:hypothetical protein [Bacteroidota bacterium]MCB9255854.1 hypothetical protein [Chitinophagales bacterium]